MSSIGGGLFDGHPDPEPDRYGSSGRPLITAKGREWAFWAVMAAGVWMAAQGQIMTVIWFMLAVVILLAGLWLAHETRRQLREVKGT